MNRTRVIFVLLTVLFLATLVIVLSPRRESSPDQAKQQSEAAQPIPEMASFERGHLSEAPQPSPTGVWVRSGTTDEVLPGAEILLQQFVPRGQERPLSSAEMRKLVTDFDPDHEASLRVSGEEGFFTIPLGTAYLSVRAPGHLPFQGIVEITGEIVVRLEVASLIRVYCSSGGRFLKDVGMVVRSVSLERPVAVSVISGHDGIAEVEIPPGEYRIDYRGNRAIRGWVPSADAERYQWGESGMLKDRLSQFPPTLSGVIAVGVGETAEVELALWAETGVEGAVLFPPLPAGYSRMHSMIYIGGERLVPHPDGELRVTGTYTEAKKRALGPSGEFIVLGLRSGPKAVRASCVDVPPLGSGRPMVFYVLSEEVTLEEGDLVDLGVLQPPSGAVFGEVVFQGEDRNYNADEVCHLEHPECTFSFREHLRGDEKGRRFLRVNERFTVPIGVPFEIHGLPRPQTSGTEITLEIRRGSLDPQLSRSLYEGVELLRSVGAVQLAIGDRFQYPIPIAFRSDADQNVEFLPAFPSEEQMVPLIFNIVGDGVETTETDLVTSLSPGSYEVFARGSYGNDLWGSTEFHVRANGLTRVPIDLQEGITVEVLVEEAGPDTLRLQPLEIRGVPWGFGMSRSLFLSFVRDGVATFTGVPRGTAFKIMPLMQFPQGKYPPSQTYHATNDLLLSYPLP